MVSRRKQTKHSAAYHCTHTHTGQLHLAIPQAQRVLLLASLSVEAAADADGRQVSDL